MSDTFTQEVDAGKRFEFGKNWESFLTTLTDERINVAEDSLKEMLEVDDLHGRTFLDIGCGSGLFSLSARRLGATVYSFDFDPTSVACATELRTRYYPNDPNWTIEEGSVLDQSYLDSLGQFDIVYSWGVLHHTGAMWQALQNSAGRVKTDGTLFIAIYTDQGRLSKMWWHVKKTYCSGFLGKAVVSIVFIPYFFGRAMLSSIVYRRNAFTRYKKRRGMSITHDWVDWLGGFPFEVSSVDKIHRLFRDRFTLKNVKTSYGPGGMNQFVFIRSQE